MHLVKPTIRKVFICLTLIITVATSYAQENSPYSRYGLGDIVPNQHVTSKGMGGISAAYVDAINHFYPNLQSINLTNPASLGYLSRMNLKDSTATNYNLLNMVFDIGGEMDWRTLKSSSQAKKFTSINTLISYMSLAFPVASQKMNRKGINWAMAVGLKPLTRINYKVASQKRITNIDSLLTIYEGDGGANQAFLSSGWRFLLNGNGNKPQTSIGVGLTTGYTFGNKNYSTNLNFLNDSVIYAASNHATTSNFGGMFFSGGLQFEKQFSKDTSTLRIGLYGSLNSNLNTTSSILRETFTYDQNLDKLRVDSVFENNNVKGKAKYPSSFGTGFTYQNATWLFGADFEVTNWVNYRYNNLADALQNSWVARVGTQYTPKASRKFLSQGRYRTGFYYGPDYVKLTNTSKPYYAFTAGASLPLTTAGQLRYGAAANYATLHTALEIGSRGNKQTSLREGFVHFSIGVTMNARWFLKPKYD